MSETLPFIRFFTPGQTKRNIVPELVLVGVLILSLFKWPLGLENTRDYMMFGLWAVVLAMIFSLALTNMQTMLLPDKSNLRLGVAVVLFQLVNAMNNGSEIIVSALIGAFLVGGLLYVVAVVSKGHWLGGGDIKLGFVSGLLLGWAGGLVCVAIFGILSVLAITVVSEGSKLSKERAPSQIPSGIVWSIAIIAAMLFGPSIVG